MEKFLFKKLEIWAVLLIVLLCLIFTFIFGYAVWHTVRGGERFGALGPTIVNIASAPKTLQELYRDMRDPVRSLVTRQPKRFPGETGFSFSYAPGSRPDAPYLLLNRYDAENAISVSELVDLNSQEILQSWRYDVDPIWSEIGFESDLIDLRASYGTRRFRGIHADLTPAGTVTVQSMNSPLLNYDVCGALNWVEDSHIYHHSIERDADGNYWVPAILEPKTVDVGGADFQDDALIQVSPEGEVLFEKSLFTIFLENGLDYLLYGEGFARYDPIHLNDIQPVFEDGVLWKKGDLWLSMRHQSMIMLYRPETNEVLWWRMGPWMLQHDVNLLDDRRISVFDNAARPVGTEKWRVEDSNRMFIVDVTLPHDHPDALAEHATEAFRALKLKTETQGRGRILENGEIFVEESNYGRAVAFAPDGTVAWQYINRPTAQDRSFNLHWSRIVDRETGDAVRALLETGACG